MLKYEISKGAVVTKIYRADRYKSTPSPWNGGPLSILYKCKMQHSKVIDPTDYSRITERMSTFGVDCTSIATWAKNKVRKQIAKGIITAAWVYTYVANAPRENMPNLSITQQLKSCRTHQ